MFSKCLLNESRSSHLQIRGFLPQPPTAPDVIAGIPNCPHADRPELRLLPPSDGGYTSAIGRNNRAAALKGGASPT